MKDVIEVDLKRVLEIVVSFNGKEFSTADVIRVYSGGFYCNSNILPNYSFNALFGKLLQRNVKFLGIAEMKKDVNINDDLGHPTTTSIWRVLG